MVRGFSDSQLLLLSVLHNTATEQNTETLVFAVHKPKLQQQLFLRYYLNRTALVISGVTQRWQILGWSKLSGKSRVFAPLIHTGA